MKASSCHWALAAACFANLDTQAASLPATPGERDYQHERQEQLLREQERRLLELQQLPGEAAPQSPEESAGDSRCVVVRSINLQGAEHLDLSTRERLLAAHRGRCLSAHQLDGLLKAITDHYLARGLVTTRVYLPQQDLSTGALQIRVVEGHLEGFDNSSLASDRELGMAFPGRPGELLDLRELEQLVEHLNRLPSRQAQLELVPGQEVGGSRVRVAGERDKPWRVSAFRDNSGERSSGEQQAGVGLDWDSPLGLADQLALRAGQDVVSDRWKASDHQGLFYSLPYGWWTFSYGYQRSAYRTRSQGYGYAFTLDGDSQVQRLGGERVLHRDAVSRTSLNLGLARMSSRTYIDGEEIGIASSEITEAQLGFGHGRRIGGAFINLDAGWQQGIGALGAQGEHDPQPGEPHALYDKYTLTLSYLQPFQLWGERFNFDALATAQRSEDVLNGPQRISLGGLNSVRGFKEQSLAGDSGYYWRNQLRWRRPLAWGPWLQEYGVGYGYDFGAIAHGRYNPDLHGRLSGHALEFRVRGRHLAAALSFARSLERPAVIERRERPVYFRAELFF
ncbi:ShlB/FhaC/HecB family hemolysin secretion/activation protein [Pseudomonas sp. QL9]|uniref:ShlB/FhaC/HecB family hemolysin secretion/activation protein n=1 Tax=Pseudomonas sp. QL9 TaxID=3242725 RepID=UPI00352AF985